MPQDDIRGRVRITTGNRLRLLLPALLLSCIFAAAGAQAQHPPGITAITICNQNGLGGQGSCPAGSADTHQIVLAPGGVSINAYADAAISDEHSSVFSPGSLGANLDYLFFVAAGSSLNRDMSAVAYSGGTGPNASGQWTWDYAKTDGYGAYSNGYGQIFTEPFNEASCPTVASGDPTKQDQTFDLNYAAPGSVVNNPAGGPGSLLMVYESVNTCIGTTGGSKPGHGAYLSTSIATSVDYGKTWPTYRATSNFAFVPLPKNNPTSGPNVPFSALGSAVCMGNDCTTTPASTYGRYQVVSPPTSMASLMAAGVTPANDVGEGEVSGFLDDASANPAPYLYVLYGNMKVARAQFNGTAPLVFQKWNSTAFSTAGIGGADTPVLPAGAFQNCGAPAQSQFGASISYVEDTQQYLLLFVCQSPGDPAGGVNTGTKGAAWMWSTSYSLADQTSWSVPQEVTGSWGLTDGSGGCNVYKGWYPTIMSMNKATAHLGMSGHVFYLWGCQQAGTPPPGRQFSSRQFRMTSVVPQSGWWWDSKLNGTGFFIEYGGKSSGGMFVGGFLYDASGNDTWLVSTGPLNGATYSSTWLKTSGGQTLTGPYKAPSNTAVGNLTIAFSDSTHAVMTRPDGTQVNLTRFSFSSGSTISPPVSGAPQSGWWWAGSALSGTGYGIEIQGSAVFIVAYVYDASGNPIWYLATGGLTTPTSYSGNWQIYAGGPQLTSPEGTYSAHAVSGSNVVMSLAFSDATHGTLTMGSTVIPIVRFQEF